MLKDKSLLWNSNLVEEIQVNDAEAITGGITVTNSVDELQFFWVIDPQDLSCQRYSLNKDEEKDLGAKENLYFVWDTIKAVGAGNRKLDGATGFASGESLFIKEKPAGSGTIVIEPGTF